MKILAVGDSRVISKIVTEVIEMAGCEPASTGNGEQAPEFRKQNPDLESIPVMMVTTESERASMVQTIAAGANNYCAKPFTPEALVTKILEFLGMGP